jgi:hypothetical protein
VRVSRIALTMLAVVLFVRPAAAQQRPLLTEDPEPVGAGRLLIEAGIDHGRDQKYRASGLEGNLTRMPTFGVSIGLSSIAELQVDGGLYNRLTITERNQAPLSYLVTATGQTTSDVEDLVVATKIRLVGETEAHPALGIRFATKLPNASNESGLGTDTTEFYAAVLAAKTMQSLRVVGNLGFGILPDTVQGARQNDVLTYGASVARALTERAELVGELNGRISTRSAGPFPGTESRGRLNLGGRYTRGSLRFDAAVFVGLTTIDPTIGFTTGFTWVMDAFTVP